MNDLIASAIPPALWLEDLGSGPLDKLKPCPVADLDSCR